MSRTNPTDVDFLEDPLPAVPHVRLSPAAVRQLEASLDSTDAPPAALTELVRSTPRRLTR